MTIDGKPISQMFADDVNDLLKKYQDSGLENSQAIGVLHMTVFNMEFDLRSHAERDVKPF